MAVMSRVEQAWCDLVESGVSRLTHRLDRSRHRMATVDALRARLAVLPFDSLTLSPAVAGHVTRFWAHRTPRESSITNDGTRNER